MSNFATATVYRRFFAHALAEVRAERAAYQADVEDWYANGDGRSPEWVTELEWSWDGEQVERTVNIGGKGYRYPYCSHGTSLWTDYDNICGGCEDWQTEIQQAQGRARSDFSVYAKRSEWFSNAPAGFAQAVGDSYGDVVVWVFETFPQ